MINALLDNYMCNADSISFGLQDGVTEQPGFFRFGRDTVCFGRCCGTTNADPGDNLPDFIDSVQCQANRYLLPFDPDEVVDNLRMERYITQASGTDGGNPVKNLIRQSYYFIRPLLPVRVRRHLQRAYLKNWDRIPFPRWPVDFSVDTLMESLLKLAVQLSGKPVPFVWFWPNGHTSCMMLTHDVETSAGRDFCSQLMDIDDSFGIKSSFQIIPEQRYTVSDSFLQNIRQRGFEINIHDLNHDGHLFDVLDTFTARVAKINRYASEYGAQGFRSAIMYRNPDWYGAFDVAYDMSIPNVAHLDPQRGGCCTVFPYFIGDIVELPLTTIQDYPLFNILGDYSINLWKIQVEMIQSHHGLISFNVHPDYLNTPDALCCYRALLSHLSSECASSNSWVTLPGDVAAWWRQRSRMSIVERGGHYVVEGPGCERAVVAYAGIVDGKLTYDFRS